MFEVSYNINHAIIMRACAVLWHILVLYCPAAPVFGVALADWACGILHPAPRTPHTTRCGNCRMLHCVIRGAQNVLPLLARLTPHHVIARETIPNFLRFVRAKKPLLLFKQQEQ